MNQLTLILLIFSIDAMKFNVPMLNSKKDIKPNQTTEQKYFKALPTQQNRNGFGYVQQYGLAGNGLGKKKNNGIFSDIDDEKFVLPSKKQQIFEREETPEKNDKVRKNSNDLEMSDSDDEERLKKNKNDIDFSDDEEKDLFKSKNNSNPSIIQEEKVKKNEKDLDLSDDNKEKVKKNEKDLELSQDEKDKNIDLPKTIENSSQKIEIPKTIAQMMNQYQQKANPLSYNSILASLNNPVLQELNNKKIKDDEIKEYDFKGGFDFDKEVENLFGGSPKKEKKKEIISHPIDLDQEDKKPQKSEIKKEEFEFNPDKLINTNEKFNDDDLEFNPEDIRLQESVSEDDMHSLQQLSDKIDIGSINNSLNDSKIKQTNSNIDFEKDLSNVNKEKFNALNKKKEIVIHVIEIIDCYKCLENDYVLTHLFNQFQFFNYQCFNIYCFL